MRLYHSPGVYDVYVEPLLAHQQPAHADWRAFLSVAIDPVTT